MAKLKDSLKIIEKRKDSSPHYRELLDIFGDILILREEYRQKMKQNIFRIDDKLISKKLSGGLPLVDFAAGELDLREPKEYFLALLKIAEEINPEAAREAMRDLVDGKLNYEAMVRESFEYLQGDESDQDDEAFDLIGFFVEESLRPALEKIARQYARRISKSGWEEGYCPVCGKEPKIGELREEEGKRFLFCSQCGLEWHFRRIKCPFCGNEEQKTLSYFTVEEDERYRVDVCERCKRYIKIVDFRNSREEANLDIEDIATIHLDMLANEEGYN
ncbi:MAG: formate dehydrogenase accessory protein FdhE [Syntrophales bacterium]